MIHRPLSQLPEIGAEIVYLDELTYEQKVGRVVYIEPLDTDTVFVYIASPDDTENIHEDFGVRYMVIVVFDSLPNETADGIYRDTVLGNYGKIVGEEN